MVASVYPEMSFISFEKNMAHPLISTHDPLEVFNSAVPSRQQWRQLQILDYITGLIYIQFYKLLTIQGCLTNNQNCIPVLQKNLVIKLRIIFVMLTCAIDPRRCPCKQISSCGLTTNSEGNTPILVFIWPKHTSKISARLLRWSCQIRILKMSMLFLTCWWTWPPLTTARPLLMLDKQFSKKMLYYPYLNLCSLSWRPLSSTILLRRTRTELWTHHLCRLPSIRLFHIPIFNGLCIRNCFIAPIQSSFDLNSSR